MRNGRKLAEQIIKFGGVGILCFVIDFGMLYVLTEWMDIYYLLSAGVSFTVSVIVNYLLSVKYVFNTNPAYGKGRNFVLFVVFSVIGLALTEILMKTGTDVIGWNYLFVKVAATVIVMVYNIVTRKIFLE